jgi:UDP-N-acetylmuramoyl-L-alanyl-D-glutamate--2,6-diaminopimelate ligase
MDTLLRAIEKLIPKKLYRAGQPIYHWLLSFTGAIIYRFPARKLTIIGVTGTKGKTSTTEYIASILEAAGYDTAVSNTIHFKINGDAVPNKYKMSMPGRFFMQHFLYKAVKAGCTHAVVEITSEGAKFYRHKWIWLDAFVFTNLHPEHIESHGSFENYKNAKLSIVPNLLRKDGILLVNADDEHAKDFRRAHNGKTVSFSEKDGAPHVVNSSGVMMTYKGVRMQSPLRGTFNLYNMLAAATATSTIGVDTQKIKEGIENVHEISGREQRINHGQPFDVVVDYAHTPDSLEALYDAYKNERKICVLGNTGGGRDTWKRPEMAKVADEHCSHIILTNEDPYDEDPEAIIDEMKEAITKKPCEVILDRKEAITRACEMAELGDAVLITGKGTDPYIMGPNGTKTPWSDAEVVHSVLKYLAITKHIRTQADGQPAEQ